MLEEVKEVKTFVTNIWNGIPLMLKIIVAKYLIVFENSCLLSFKNKIDY